MRKWFWVLDAIVVVSFVAVGRDSHGFSNDWEETLRIALPFLLALAIAVVIVQAWKNPQSLLTGLALGVATLAIGMVLRHFVWDGGTAPIFVLVAGAWLVGWMVAWRLVAIGVIRLRAQAG